MQNRLNRWARDAGRRYGAQSPLGKAFTIFGIAALLAMLGLFTYQPTTGLGSLVVGLILLLIYFIPAITASGRDLPNKNSVFIINLFLGWTLIGWVIALAMAVGQANTNNPVPQQTSQQPSPKPAIPLSDIRQCPFCAEDIKKAAVVCKHCDRDVEPITN